jgi:GT2 family glycosyltransferase
MEVRSRVQDQHVRVSAIVIGYNGRRYLRDAITSLFDQDLPEDEFEVVYVDNCSRDGSADFVSARFPQATVIRLEENRGFYRAFNVAAESARGDYVVAVPQDVVAHRRLLPELVHCADQDPDVLVAVPNTVAPGSPDYRPSRRDGRVTECTWVTLSRLGFVRLDRGTFTPAPRRTLAGVGCATLLRRDLVERSGCLFDEGASHYAGDVELGLRANVVEGKVMQVPTAIVYHVGEEAKKIADRRLLFRYAEGARDQVLAFRKTMTNAEFVVFFPLMMLGLAMKATVLRVSRPARALLVMASLAASPLIAVSALVRASVVREARDTLRLKRRAADFWLLQAIMRGVDEPEGRRLRSSP